MKHTSQLLYIVHIKKCPRLQVKNNIFVVRSVFRGYLARLRRGKTQTVAPSNSPDMQDKTSSTLFFFIRTSNFGAEAKRSYFFFDLRMKIFLRRS